MFVPITNVPRDYAWGSTTAIAELLGRTPSGGPEAELWLGDHPGSPARLVDGDGDGDGDGDLRSVAEHRLPFLLKVLAADAPLSLQAHPTLAQAAEGFARENRAGVPLSAPERNYKDPLHKPELIVAVSEEFDALSGFRPVLETRADLLALPRRDGVEQLLLRLRTDADLRDVFEWLITRGDGVDAVVADVVGASEDAYGLQFETVRDLASAYPGDPGIVISLLLHRIRLTAGEALYLRAGNIHAYLRGLGIELMAASDNVLRGGLTPKHVDVPELLRVLDFAPAPAPRLVPEEPSPGVRLFRPDVPDFLLIESVGGAVDHALSGPAIALCTEGEVRLQGALGEQALQQGDAVYVDEAELALRVSGAGTVFVATTNR